MVKNFLSQAKGSYKTGFLYAGFYCNSVVHPPFEQHQARPTSTVPHFLFQSIKGLSKADLRFLWVLLSLLKMIQNMM